MKPYFAYRSFWKELRAKENFVRAGVRQFCVFPANTTNSLGEPYSDYPSIWKWFDTYDFSPVDQQIEDILRMCPDAELLFMVDLNSPLWLSRQLGCGTQPGDSFPNLTGCLANPSWCETTQKYLRALMQYVQQRYGDRILCFILACGTTDEWMDYSAGTESEGKLIRYREWSAQKGYPIPEEIPTFARRFDSPHENGLRDPVVNRDAIRYWSFHSDLVADGILLFAEEARTLMRPGQELGVFYGYVMELAHKRLVQAGHLAYEKLLASNRIDFFISPGSYSDREMGGGGGFMNPNATIHRYGKSYLHEIDHRTHTANMQLTPHVQLSWMVPWPDLQADIAGLRREFCRSLMHGASLWWFDMWGGFYPRTEVLDELARMKRLWDHYADFAREPEAEVAVFVDPDSVCYINDQNPQSKTITIFNRVQSACNHLGTPFTVHDLSDLPHLKHAPKLAILPALVELTPEKRTLIEHHLRSSALLWLGPCWLSDGERWEQQVLRGEHLPDPASLSAETICASADRAGAHRYCSAPLPVWISDNLLSVHSATSQTIELRLKKPVAQVTELFSGRILAADTDVITYTMSGSETILLHLQNAMNDA